MGAEEEKEALEQEKEFDAAFEEEDKSTDDDDSDKDSGDDDTDGSDDEGDKDDDKDDSSSDETDWEKRFKDTQSWGTKLSQENKDLKDRLDKLESSAKSDSDSEDADEAWSKFVEEQGEDFSEVLSDYDLEKPFKAIFNQSRSGTADGEVLKRVEAAEQAAQLARFDLAITGGYIDDKGSYVKGHPDAVEIFAMSEYAEYHEKELEAGNKLLKSNDPADAIKFIGQFKEEVLKKAAEDHDKKAEEEAKKRKEALESTVDGKNRESKASASGGTSVTDQQAEFDKAFDEF